MLFFTQVKKNILFVIFLFSAGSLAFGQIKNLNFHNGQITHAIFHNSFMMTAGEDKAIKVWESQKCKRTFYSPTRITNIEPHPLNSDIIIISGEEGTVLFYSIKKEVFDYQLTFPRYPFAQTPSVSITHNTTEVIINAKEESKLILFDTKQQQVISNLSRKHFGLITAQKSDLISNLFISGDTFGTVVLWNLKTLEPLKSFEYNGEVVEIKISNTKKYAFVFLKDSKAHVINLVTRQEVSDSNILRSLSHDFRRYYNFIYKKEGSFWIAKLNRFKEDYITFNSISEVQGEAIVSSNPEYKHKIEYIKREGVSTAELNFVRIVNAHKDNIYFNKIFLKGEQLMTSRDLRGTTSDYQFPSEIQIGKVKDKSFKADTIFTNRGFVFACDINSKNQVLLGTGDLRLVDLESGLISDYAKSIFPMGWVLNTKFFNNGKYAIASGQGKSLAILDIASKSTIELGPMQEDPMNNYQKFAFNDDESKLVSRNQNDFYVWDMKDKTFLKKHPVKSEYSFSVLFQDNKVYLPDVKNGTISVYDIETGNLLQDIIINNYGGYVTELIKSPDKNWIIAFDALNKVYFINSKTNKVIKESILCNDMFDDFVVKTLSPDMKWEISRFQNNFLLSSVKK